LSVMIEINRRLYMDEHSGASTGFGKVRSLLGKLITIASDAAAKNGPYSR
jgi:hypothetical protein